MCFSELNICMNVVKYEYMLILYGGCEVMIVIVEIENLYCGSWI